MKYKYELTSMKDVNNFISARQLKLSLFSCNSNLITADWVVDILYDVAIFLYFIV